MSVAIISILGSIAPPMLIQMKRFIVQNTARNDVQRDARHSLDIINRMMRQAKGLTIVIDQLSGQPPYSRVAFTTIQGRTVSFWQDNKKLYASIDGRTTELARDLRFIAFTFPRTDSITIVSVAMTMEQLSFEGTTKALELSIEKVRVMN